MKKSFLLLSAMIWLSMGYSQTVKGKLFYDLGNSKRKAAAGLVVYLLSNNTQTAPVIKAISKYETTCDEKKIKSDRNYKVASTDKEGYFFFNNIKKGSYLLKICTYYGGYYKFTIKADFKGTLSLPDYEADPPIK